jgi:hypothetical protein
MRRTLVRFGARQARRHPRIVLKVGTTAVRHPRGTLRLVRWARQGPAMARDGDARRRAGRAAASAGRAAGRARSIGPLGAGADPKVRRDLLEAVRGVRDAYRESKARARRRRRVRRVAVGATLVGAAAYAGRARRG